MTGLPSEPGEGEGEQEGAGPPRRLPDGIGVIVVLAVIPFTLVWLLVSAIFGDAIGKYGPWVFYFAVFAFVLWTVVNGHVAAPPAWGKVAQGFFPHHDRRRQMRNVALLLFGSFVVITILNVQVTFWLLWLRETLLNWTVPWPGDWN